MRANYLILPIGYLGQNIMSKVSKKQCEELLRTLQARFQANMTRHKGLVWGEVEDRLEANAEKLWSLS